MFSHIAAQRKDGNFVKFTEYPYFFLKIQIVGTSKNRLYETFHMSTNLLCFCRKPTKVVPQIPSNSHQYEASIARNQRTDFNYFKSLFILIESILLHVTSEHYENRPMQYTAIFVTFKNNETFIGKKKIDKFHFFAQNIDCGYMLELPCRGSSNNYPQSMFWIKNKENRYTPAYPSFTI